MSPIPEVAKERFRRMGLSTSVLEHPALHHEPRNRAALTVRALTGTCMKQAVLDTNSGEAELFSAALADTGAPKTAGHGSGASPLDPHAIGKTGTNPGVNQIESPGED
jgi:hypothetical protein